MGETGYVTEIWVPIWILGMDWFGALVICLLWNESMAIILILKNCYWYVSKQKFWKKWVFTIKFLLSQVSLVCFLVIIVPSQCPIYVYVCSADWEKRYTDTVYKVRAREVAQWGEHLPSIWPAQFRPPASPIIPWAHWSDWCMQCNLGWWDGYITLKDKRDLHMLIQSFSCHAWIKYILELCSYNVMVTGFVKHE